MIEKVLSKLFVLVLQPFLNLRFRGGRWLAIGREKPIRLYLTSTGLPLPDLLHVWVTRHDKMVKGCCGNESQHGVLPSILSQKKSLVIAEPKCAARQSNQIEVSMISD